LDDNDEIGYKGLVVGSNSDVSKSKDFETKARKLIEGEFYKAKDECMVSQKFSELNGLKVGDTINIQRSEKDGPYPLKIVGIFEDNTALDGGDAAQYMTKNPVLNRNNEILTGMDTIKAFSNPDSINAVYFLKNPEMLKAFSKELYEKGLPKYYDVKTDETGYNAVVGPVENMAKVTNTFMIVVLILGGIILLLISTLATRERKYEIGVLRAMGMKKAKIAIGFVTEMLVLTFVCLIVGFSASAVATQPIADSLLENQIEIAEQTQANNKTDSISSINPTDQAAAPTALSELKVHLGVDAAIEITLIAILLAIVASIIGVVYITRYEPTKILSERN
jgi:putative ABC transport system permease protein